MGKFQEEYMRQLEKDAMKSPEELRARDRKMKFGCFGIIGFLLLIFMIGAISGPSESPKEKEVINYYDESQEHKDIAYRTIKHAVINNLKDPDSYETVNYGVTLNKARMCYNVVLQYRAKNSFGGYVVEQVTGTVEIDSNGNGTVVDIAKIE